MKRLFYILGLLFSISSLQGVEIVNNTQKTIDFRDFETIRGRKIMIYPFTLNPGETHKDMNIASCEARIKHTKGTDLPIVFSIDVYKLDGLKENTLISFIEVDGKIQAHKLDKIFPKALQTFAGK